MPSQTLARSFSGARQATGNWKRNPARRQAFARLLAFTSALQPVLALPAAAQSSFSNRLIGGTLSFGSIEAIQFAMFTGAMGAALLSAVWLIRERSRTAEENANLRTRTAELDSAVQRLQAFAALRNQRVVVWEDNSAKPDVIGNLPDGSGAPAERSGFLAFGRWLDSRSAARLEQSVAALRKSGTAFDLTVTTQTGASLEVQGRISGSLAFVRFVAVDGVRAELAETRIERDRLESELGLVRNLLDAAPFPVWTRTADGGLDWVNAAYAQLAEADGPSAAIAAGTEIFGTKNREAIARKLASDGLFRETVSAVAHGDRVRLDTVAVANGGLAGGLALDATALEHAKAETERHNASHQQVLDQLTTAVAIFDENQKLRFYNQAFQKLWDLETAFVESAPSHAALLDRLRTEGKLAEQPEWRSWKDEVLGVYRAINAVEDWWHLPDGRTIRTIAQPDPRGGVTLVFENMTEKMDLESRNKTLSRLQTETLGNLVEGVAVFGSDGRIRLSNPAFAELWELPEFAAQTGSHMSAIRQACEGRMKPNPWPVFAAAITGFDDARAGHKGTVETASGTVLDYALVPLTNGQVMITAIDITDTVNVERALKDKNEALQRVDKLKSDFVENISYELRSPLTNIIGFTDMLQMPMTGELNETQGEYVGHIATSSATLLAIVNDILDLATVDAGMLELDIGPVDIAATAGEAGDAVAGLLAEHGITLDVRAPKKSGRFFADQSRVRQVLVNLLTNAANHAPEGSSIVLEARRDGADVVFTVNDAGPGIPDERLENLFKRFEPVANGGRRRGAGLGLAIVKTFVDLHGGSVSVQTAAGKGTVFECRFPSEPAQNREAAE